MIVGCNESEFLERCFSSVGFCDEIIYTDLESNDDSLLIAQRYTPKVFNAKKKEVPSGEYAQADMVLFTKNDWVLFIDPDEFIDKQLANEIELEFAKISSQKNIGAMIVPWQFYFKGKKLKGTVWGGRNNKFLIAHKDRFQIEKITHLGRKLRQHYDYYEIHLNSEKTNVLHHYWMNSFRIFFRKHQRYLKLEAKNQFEQGQRMSLIKMLATPYREFKYSFFKKKGYLDGFLGFFLSCFWAYYQMWVAVGLYYLSKRAVNS